jgi:hypothetical protein
MQRVEAGLAPWRGQALAAREYADMALHGTPVEKAWAAGARELAWPELARAMDDEVKRTRTVPQQPLADTCATGPAASVLWDLRVYEHDLPTGTNGSEPDPMWSRNDVVSGAGLVSPVQRKLLEHFLARDRARLLERRTLDVRSGSTEVLALGSDSVLRLHGEVAERVRVTVAYRYLSPEGVVFSPALTVELRDTEVVLLGPADTLTPQVSSGVVRLLLVSARPGAEFFGDPAPDK